MLAFRIVYIIFVLLALSACEVINSVTVGKDGEVSFNAPLKPISKTPTKPTQSVSPAKTSVLPKPISRPLTPTQSNTLRPIPASIPTPAKVLPGEDETLLPILEAVDATQTTGSIMEGLPELTKSIFLTERESAGMPRVNGERIDGDIYGSYVLIVKYTKNINKIRYSDSIIEIKKLGQVEGSNAKVPYPVSFIKIFFTDENDDSVSKIFGIVESE